MQPAITSHSFRFRAELVAAVALFCLLLFASLAPLMTESPMSGGASSGGEGNLLRQIVYVLILGTAIACSRLFSLPNRLNVIPPGILLTLTWCGLSMLWAINPGIGARRLFLTLIVIVSIFLLVERAGYEKTVGVVRLLLVPLLIANYIAVIGWPDWGIHQAATEEDPSIVGAWRGILLQKNFAGAVCALTIVFFSFDAQRIRASTRIVVIALAGYFLYRSESKTSADLLIFSIAMAALFLRYGPRYRKLLLTGAVALSAGVALLVWQYWDLVAAPFSSEDALTGRVQIWPPLFQFWRDHWLLGSGFGSFWNIGQPEPISSYADGWVSQISSGHNGFLDLLVQIGLPGLLLTLAAVFVAPMHTLLSSANLVRSRRSLLLAVILFGVCHNFTESSLFDRDATVHVFLMLAIALLGLEARAEERPDAVLDKLPA